ncbi:O-antigen ligase family protein [Aquimarina sp. M1]
MASGLTINSIQIAITSLLILYLIKNTSQFLTKIFLTILYIWCIYLLVILDSRSPLLISLILGVIIGMGIRTIIRLLTRYWVVLALSAIFFVNIFYNTDIFESFKRPGELREGFFKRPKIWGIALSNTFNDLRFLTGYGLNNFGNYISRQNVNLRTTHNIFLQIFYDFGIPGIIILGYFLRKTMIILLKKEDLNLMVIFVSFFLFGCLESVPSYYTFTPTLIFIPIIIIIYYNKENEAV